MITDSPKFWMLLPVFLLLSSLALGVTTVMFATNDPAFAVVDDYYERGNHVDEQLAEQAETEALGWKFRLINRSFLEGSSRTTLRFRLLGPDGEALLGLSGELQGFHNARAAQLQVAPLRADPQEGGVYLADFKIDRAGWWVWRYDLQRDGDRSRGEMRSQLTELPR
jgi:hypothetical protein